jgi:hypothetical protein
MTPGRKLAVAGTAALDGRMLLFYNPDYTFLA